MKVKYSDFKIGDTFSFKKVITLSDVDYFVGLSGDFNPIHMDDEFARDNGFERRIVHGMLLAGLFSRLIGMHCPGKYGLYLSQTLNFKHPVFCGEEVAVRGEITGKNDAIRVMTLRTEIARGEQKVVTGEAKVRVLYDG